MGAVLGLSATALCCATREPSDVGPALGGDSPDLPSVEDAPVTDDASRVEGDRVTRVYVGQDDAQLVVFALDDDAGMLTELSRTPIAGSTSFVTMDPSGTRGAAVLEDASEVVGLAFAPGTGAVREVGSRRSSRGAGPTHVSIDRTGGYALVADYGGGTVGSYALGADGSLGDSVDGEAPGADAHQILTTPSNRWALVPCLGADHVAVLSFDAATGALATASIHATHEGAGPRHLVVTRGGDHVYLANERDSSVEVLAFDDASGAVRTLEVESTLPSEFDGRNTVAEIALGNSEGFVYVSNRGHDSIAVFAIEDDHRVVLRGHALLGARRPRSFAIDPAGRFLLAASQDDDVIVRFRIEDDGSLTRLGTTPTSGSPTFVGAFAIPTR